MLLSSTDGIPVSVTTRPLTSFTELVITGTAGGDSIEVSQSGSTFTIQSNGNVQTISGSFGDLAIHAGQGGGTITVDSSVTLRNLIYGGAGADVITDLSPADSTIVSIGGGADVLTGNGVNTHYWADGTDTVNASPAEIRGGWVNTITQFYQPWTSNPLDPNYISLQLLGQNLPEPLDIGVPVTFANTSLWGTGPTMTDVNQGTLDDCYVVGSIQSLAYAAPTRLEQMAVDLGDGTYAVKFTRSGISSYVRVDGDFSGAQSCEGVSGNLWPLVFEKAYAYFRKGQNSYASLDEGYSGDFLADLGVASNSLYPSAPVATLASQLTAALADQKAVVLNSNSTQPVPSPLIDSHSYTLVAFTSTASGYVLTLRNPWGAYVGPDAIVQITMAQFQGDFGLSSETGFLSSPATVTKTWTGAVSNDWNDPGNWSPIGVPGSTDYVDTNGGHLTVPAGFNIARLLVDGGTTTIAASGTVSPALALSAPVTNPATSVVSTLMIAGGAKPTGALDLGSSALILQNGGVSGRDLIESEIAYARDGGAWDRGGITSSVAQAAHATDGMDSLTLGVALNSDLSNPYTTFNGIAVGPNDVLVKLTYGGDANLDGVINGDDYFRIDQGFVNHLTGWVNGDFNHDGVINGDDYFIIDSMFINQSGRAAAAQVAADAVQFGPSYLAQFSAAQLEAIGMGASAAGAAGVSADAVQLTGASPASSTSAAAPMVNTQVIAMPGTLVAVGVHTPVPLQPLKHGVPRRGVRSAQAGTTLVLDGGQPLFGVWVRH